MMRPLMRILVAGPLAVAALAVGSPCRGAGHAAAPGTGIVVGTGTVQPAGDPHYLYIFGVLFNPDPVVHDFIHAGDSFTVTLANNTGLLLGTNGQPPDWAATSFSASTVTWSYIGDNDITAGQPLDPAPGPFFQIESSQLSSGTFSYTFQDSLPGNFGGNSGGGTFTVNAVPEPASILLVGLGAPAGAYLIRRSRRRAARA